jgi:structure-specific endonuclease subunit SLX1
MGCYVYLLLSSDNSTYIGATVDLNRRLRQHNKELKGGAFITGAKVLGGETWIRVAHIEGFPDWKSALQFEWRWKQLTRQIKIKMIPLERRILALKNLLSLDKPTTKSVPYSEWPTMPKVIIEDIEAQTYYDKLF